MTFSLLLPALKHLFSGVTPSLAQTLPVCRKGGLQWLAGSAEIFQASRAGGEPPVPF